MLAFLDRGNIGNAEIAGMAKDLDLVGNKYPWLLTIFYITYILFEFSLLFWKIFPAHIVGAFVVFGWWVPRSLSLKKKLRKTDHHCAQGSYCYPSVCSTELGWHDGHPIPAGRI